MSFESNWVKSIAALFKVSNRLADECSVRQYQPWSYSEHLFKDYGYIAQKENRYSAKVMAVSFFSDNSQVLTDTVATKKG